MTNGEANGFIGRQHQQAAARSEGEQGAKKEAEGRQKGSCCPGGATAAGSGAGVVERGGGAAAARGRGAAALCGPQGSGLAGGRAECGGIWRLSPHGTAAAAGSVDLRSGAVAAAMQIDSAGAG
eukprot:6524640-Prymnesium_polylepis.1